MVYREHRVAGLYQWRAEDLHLAAGLLLWRAGGERRVPAAPGDVHDPDSVRPAGTIYVHEQRTAGDHAERDVAFDAGVSLQWLWRRGVRFRFARQLPLEEAHHRPQIVRRVGSAGKACSVPAAFDHDQLSFDSDCLQERKEPLGLAVRHPVVGRSVHQQERRVVGRYVRCWRGRPIGAVLGGRRRVARP